MNIFLIPKLDLNMDFSFIRFLKVVKSLYETSTFTQLGKTVGSALNPSNGHSRKPRKGDPEKCGNEDADEKPQSLMPTHDSVFDIFTEVCTRKVVRTNCANMENAACREDAPKQNLLEQVMNCPCLVHHEDDEYFSDEETFRTRTDDETQAQSFESLTDDDEDFQSTKRRRGGRPRPRHR